MQASEHLHAYMNALQKHSTQKNSFMLNPQPPKHRRWIYPPPINSNQKALNKRMKDGDCLSVCLVAAVDVVARLYWAETKDLVRLLLACSLFGF